jgi:DNA helicase-2/ATP-dependent DNA helicase PcrA
MDLPSIEYFWNKRGFKPNPNQQAAILHTEGPLFLTAGPGSGKTRVLLWRTVYLIVWKGIHPSRIFLATFTEKAAHQLKEGLRSLLGSITNETGEAYDISGMSIGTLHSICQEILVDANRRFSADGIRGRAPALLDELGQYFKVYNRRFWVEMLSAGGLHTGENSEAEQIAAQEAITGYLTGRNLNSRHYAVQAIIRLFNRFSEENLQPEEMATAYEFLEKLILMYDFYRKSLIQSDRIQTVDFSLLQQKAFNKIRAFAGSGAVYEHVIVDEYQDTNAIQELIYFELAKSAKNLCVVGDDDQALYRFRGATVENLVEFETRCAHFLGVKPTKSCSIRTTGPCAISFISTTTSSCAPSGKKKTVQGITA